jgi:hypothetical protein
MQPILPENGRKIYRANAVDHTRYQLVEEIIARSVADTWHEAKREWELVHIFFADPKEPGTCLCGHNPIVEHCILLNRENGNKAIVGNVCVTRFMGIPVERLFTPLRRITKNRAAALNAEAIEYAYGKGWLNDWERRFYLETCRKRRLFPKQKAKRVQINEKILHKVTEGHCDA